jgi:nitrogen-specific signal transduction histidine kinase
MKNNPVTSIKKRTLAFSIVLTIALVLVNYFISKSRREERKTQLVLELIQADGILSGELYRLFNGLEDDFQFFEAQIKNILSKKKPKKDITTLISFLNTHPDYFKVRLTTVDGKEIFKLVQKPDHTHHEESKSYYNLLNQPFFNELKEVGHKNFFFSSIEPNIINGVVEMPIRPTVRVSRRLYLDSKQEAVLIINIDGKRILNLFKELSLTPLNGEKILLDHQSFQVATTPLRDEAFYATNKVRIENKIFVELLRSKENHGSLETDEGAVVFTKIPLPRSDKSWYLVSKISEQTLNKIIHKEKLTTLFWEVLVFLILVSWFWRDENKRHKEQVVQVLLKERSEFIQNVSHQLKTPLTIIYNELTQGELTSRSSGELKKEVSFLIKVVEDLLLLSQIDALKKISLVEENIIEVINESLDLVAQKAKAKEVLLRLDVPNELTDNIEQFNRLLSPDLLKSAFFNVLDNAVEHSPKSGTVFVSLNIENEKILIRVKDSGPGVSADLVPYIFQRFTRDMKSIRKGSGLGLAIAKKIIELNGGEISLQSNESGACFQIIL